MKTPSSPLNRRRFLQAAGSGGVLASVSRSAAEPAAAGRTTTGIVDCQSHLFLQPVLELMRRRRSDPLVYDRDGTTYLRMGEWLRKVPPSYLSVEAKLASMDANGIGVTLLSRADSVGSVVLARSASATPSSFARYGPRAGPRLAHSSACGSICFAITSLPTESARLSNNDPGPEGFGDDGPAVARLVHDSMAEVIARHPARFRGLCTLPLQDERAAAAELDRCVRKLAFVGVLLYTNLADAWCDEPGFHWLYARAEELGIPIVLHPARPMTTGQVKGYELTSTLGNMFENTIALARIVASGLLDRHLRLKLVCPHLGGTLPYISGRMDHQLRVLKRGPQNLQRKPSDYLRSIYMDVVSPLPEAMRFAVEFSGADRLLFSSDHPWVEPGEILRPLRSLGLPAAAETAILSGNARALFKL